MESLFNNKFNDQSRNKRFECNNIFTMENKPKPCNRQLYVRRLRDLEKSSGNIGKQIYDSFNDPSQYFITPVQVGRNIEIKNFDSIPKRRLTRKNDSAKIKKSSTRNDLSVNDKSNITIKTNLNKQQLQNNNFQSNNYELIDNIALKNIFDSFRKDISSKQNNRNLYDDNNSKSFNQNIQQNLPIVVTRSLNYQNKILNIKNINDKDVKKMAHFISKKINKSEKDLMINKVDLYKYKKEVLNEIADKKSNEDNNEQNNWNINLRKPENFKGVRKSYVNISNEFHPFWKVVIQKSPNIRELAIRPDFDLNNKEFKKFTKNRNIQKNIGKVKNLENLDCLSIKGKNLFDIEYKREMSTKGRKILHKVFVENGKIISEQDINNIFGDATLYKNYDNKKINQVNEEIYENNDENNHSFLKKNREKSHVALTNPNIDFYDKSVKSISRPRSNMLNNN